MHVTALVYEYIGRKLTSVTTSRVAESAVASTVAFTALEGIADTGRSGAKVTSWWSGAEVVSGRRDSVRVDDVAELAGITASTFTYFEKYVRTRLKGSEVNETAR